MIISHACLSAQVSIGWGAGESKIIRRLHRLRRFKDKRLQLRKTKMTTDLSGLLLKLLNLRNLRNLRMIFDLPHFQERLFFELTSDSLRRIDTTAC